MLFLLAPKVAWAKGNTIDEQVKAFDKASSSEQRAMSENLLDEFYKLKLFRDRIYPTHDTPIDTLRAEVWLQYASYVYDRDDYNTCYEYLLKAMQTAEGGTNYRQLTLIYSWMSFLMSTVSDLTKALEYGDKCLKLEKKIGTSFRVLMQINNMADLYNSYGYPKEALYYVNEGLRIVPKVDDDPVVLVFYSTVSEVYLKLGDMEKARDFIDRAYKMVAENSGDLRIVRVFQQMAELYLQTHEPEKVISCIQELFTSYKKAVTNYSAHECYIYLGRAYQQLKQPEMAKKYFSKAASFFHDVHSPEMQIKAERGLYEVYRPTDISLALSHLEKVSLLQDSIYQSQLSQRVTQFSALYKNRKLQENYEKERDRQWLILTIAGVLILGMVVVAFYYRIRLRKRRQRILAEKRQMEQRDRFFTNVTHEFRTPLTIIQMAAQTIKDTPDNASEVREHANVIVRQGYGLLQMVNDVLDFAKFRSYKVLERDWRHGDIVNFTLVIVDSFVQVAKEKGIDIDFESDKPQIDVDFVPSALQSILVNLISNAIKYSNSDTTVRIRLAQNDNKLVMTVQDEGIGMTEEDCAHAFELFYQAENFSGRKGSGIGLALVKSCVNIMKGTISVKSQKGKGSLFTIEFPMRSGLRAVAPFEADPMAGHLVPELSSGREESSSSTNASNTSQADKNDEKTEKSDGEDTRPVVLVVEDVSEVARYTAALLSDKYKVCFASDGKNGLVQATDLVPDIIISDVMMPEMDGFEFCKAVRASELLCHVPVILVTARVAEEDRIKGLRVGADAYIAKPFNREELRVTVDKLIEQRQILRRKYARAIDEDREEEAGWNVQDRQFLSSVQEQTEILMRERNISVNALADKLCVSPRQLQRRLLALTGKSPLAYVTTLRIRKAKGLLRQGVSIMDTAMACGFEERSNFTRTFKKVTGQSPSQFAKGE